MEAGDEESTAIDFSGKSLSFSVMNPKTCGKTWTGTTFSISRAVGRANVPETWEIMGSTCHWNCYRDLGKTGVDEGETSAERPKVWKFVGEIPGPV